MGTAATRTPHPTVSAPAREMGVSADSCSGLCSHWASGKEVVRELRGTSVSLGPGPLSPSSTWLSMLDSLRGKRSALKISWRDSCLSWEMLHTVLAFQECAAGAAERKTPEAQTWASRESFGCLSPTKIISSVPTTTLLPLPSVFRNQHFS